MGKGDKIMAEKARKIFISKQGIIKITPYDISVNNEDVEEYIIKDLLGIKEYEDTITFHGKCTIVIEEQIEMNETESSFEKVGQKETKEEV